MRGFISIFQFDPLQQCESSSNKQSNYSPTFPALFSIFWVFTLFAIGAKLITYYQRYAGCPGALASILACGAIWANSWILIYKSPLAVPLRSQVMSPY